ncbi:hypothetical protein LUZ60_015094 [Juncus effusus]|nr:hypothetical protein LUZ60_015094 [Juncus effusus]
MDQQSPPPPFFSPNSSNPGFPIAAIIAVGFLATSLVLTVYYIMVARFWLAGSRQSQSDYIPPIYFSYDVENDHQGVDPKLIKSIPVVKFSKTEDKKSKKMNRSFHECSVCLAEFQEKESLKILPGCLHPFHVDCIDTWLQFNVNCPMCRSVVTSSSLMQAQLELVVEGDERGDGDVREEGEKSVRRSFSMDCFSERRIKRGEASTSRDTVNNGDTSGRFMRLVHSFRLGRSSRSMVLPIQIEP